METVDRELPKTLLSVSVPFEQKDEAKKLGGRWDGSKKVWVMPNEEAVNALARKLGQKTPREAHAAAVAGGQVPATHPNDGATIPDAVDYWAQRGLLAERKYPNGQYEVAVHLHEPEPYMGRRLLYGVSGTREGAYRDLTNRHAY